VEREEIEEIFRELGVLLEGHFLLASGRHSHLYFEKFRLLEWPEHADRFSSALAERSRHLAPDVVTGPTTGGLLVAYAVARHLGLRAIYAERTREGRGYPRGSVIEPGAQVLIVDDVLTTGGSVRETWEAVERLGGHVCGVGVLVDRSQDSEWLGTTPFVSVYRAEVQTFAPEECPLCRQGAALVVPGGSKRKV
jgi:orotate phosphoribosyltransferase